MISRRLISICSMLLLQSVTAISSEVQWKPWSADIFDQAKTSKKFVLLDLEAVWCHWCHVMDEKTYGDSRVQKLLKSKFITVRVDQDANPDLSNRYGDWGWPATIVFSANGSEIVKRRGYIPPDNMVSMLEAIIDDPSPGPSVLAEPEISPAPSPFLNARQRQKQIEKFENTYDEKYGGWGRIHKFIDTDSLDLEMMRARSGDAAAGLRVRNTLDAAIKLIDPVAGGLYQYSDELDWSSPHFEKIMWYQANGVRHYAQAYVRWNEKKYLEAANAIATYLLNTLRSPGGAFYTSQDADVDQATPGKVYFAMTEAERRDLGRQPSIDHNIYARENGWAILGLAEHFAATGNQNSLKAAVKAAEWVLANRRLPGGGFSHGADDRGGPYLGDTLSMGRAALTLYAATGDRQWLTVASEAGDFIAQSFVDHTGGGFLTSMTREASVGVFRKPVKQIDEQIRVTRFANLLNRYFGSEKYLKLAKHGARYITSQTVLNYPHPLPGIVLAVDELRSQPIHITVVGPKGDPRSAQLHAAGLRYPSIYKRLDWWDKREGALPNPDVQYPELNEPAAFACSSRICSLPVLKPSQLKKVVDDMMSATNPKKG